MCYWDQLNSIWDWTPLRPLYRRLRFWQIGIEIYLSCSPQDKPHGEASLLFKPAIYQSGVAAYPFSLPLYRGQMEEGQSGWPAGDWRQTDIIWKSKRRDKNLHMCIAWFSLLFTTSLRINNYLLVEDDQISHRKKLIRSILMGLLWKPKQQENDKENKVNWDLGKGSRYYLGRRLGEIEIKIKPRLEKGRGWVKQKKHSSDCKSAMKGKREKCAWKSTFSDFFLQFLVLLSLFFKLPWYDFLLW